MSDIKNNADNIDATENLDYEPDLIELEDQNGDFHNFEVLDATDIADTRYFMLSPVEEEVKDDEEGSFLIMKVLEDSDGEYLEIVEDHDELQSAVQIFSTRLEDFFNIDLDEK